MSKIDKIEAWLSNAELMVPFTGDVETTMEKFAALVRVYRDANQFCIEHGYDAGILGTAEAKAKEIIKEKKR